jgi:hypothetical protein
MKNIQSAAREIVLSDMDAYSALTNGYMNMSSYAEQIKPIVENLTFKQITTNALVVALSRLREELKSERPLTPEVFISNITTKLPLTEIIYENTETLIAKLETFHKKISLKREDFLTTTVGTTELNIVCSSNMKDVVLAHFGEKPKFIANNLAAVGVSFDQKYFSIPNTLFSLISVVAKARINIAEIVSTYTELIFVIEEKDFSQTVSLFSELHKKQNK